MPGIEDKNDTEDDEMEQETPESEKSEDEEESESGSGSEEDESSGECAIIARWCCLLVFPAEASDQFSLLRCCECTTLSFVWSQNLVCLPSFMRELLRRAHTRCL